MTTQSSNTFLSYWSTENLWLKSRTLLLLCVSYTSLWQSTVQQTLLVPPSVNVTLTMELQDDTQNIHADVHIYVHTNTHTQIHIQLGKYQLGTEFHTGLSQNTADVAQTVRDSPHWEYKRGRATRFHLFFIYSAPETSFSPLPSRKQL